MVRSSSENERSIKRDRGGGHGIQANRQELEFCSFRLAHEKVSQENGPAL